MKRFAKLAVVLVVLVGAAAGSYRPAKEYWIKRHLPQWETAEVTRGRIVSVVNATGTVKPVLSVRVGAIVSGPIVELYTDFNDEVREGQILAKIDPRVYKAAVDRDEATLEIRAAERRRVQALLDQARNDEDRAKALQRENEAYISQAELDQLRFKRASLEAEVLVAEASVKQAQANLANSKANLEYTDVCSPVNGIVIDRKIDKGQALAASFQTPELFVVAPDLRQKIHLYASVDETEIGRVQQAYAKGQPVHFTVDAHEDELFQGVIEEIRLSSTEVQNVVTYPVIVAAANPDLKLLPGMTAEISFRVDERVDTLKIPNAALRYYPDEKYIRKEDRKLLQGDNWMEDRQDTVEMVLSAEEKAEARRKRNRRHVWVVDGDYLRAVEIVVGLSDAKYSELVSGPLQEGQKVVTGIDLGSE